MRVHVARDLSDRHIPIDQWLRYLSHHDAGHNVSVAAFGIGKCLLPSDGYDHRWVSHARVHDFKPRVLVEYPFPGSVAVSIKIPWYLMNACRLVRDHIARGAIFQRLIDFDGSFP